MSTIYGRLTQAQAWRMERAAEVREERLTDLERLLETLVDAYNQAEALGLDGGPLDGYGVLVSNEIIKIETGND